jgi:hypothetical protein
MNDKTLERELEALLLADPAPDFRARVLARIAMEPTRSVWPLRWAFAGGSVLAILVVSIVTLRTPAPSPTHARDLDARSLDVLAYHAVPAAIGDQDVRRRERSRSTSTTRTIGVKALPQFEVIVYAPEAAAWRRLLGGVDGERVDLSRMARADEPKPLPGLEDFVLSPITIELLTVVDEQGEHP